MKKIKYGFGDNLKRMRELSGYSQASLAERLSLQPSTISHFENETRLPSFKNLFIIGKRTGWSIDDLMGLKDIDKCDIKTAMLDGKLKRIADILNENTKQ